MSTKQKDERSPASASSGGLAGLAESAATSLNALWQALAEANLDWHATDVKEWHAGVWEIVDELRKDS